MTYVIPRLYINGSFRDGFKSTDIINPATEDVIGQLPHAGKAELDAALAAANTAFPAWAQTTAFERSALIRRAAGIVRERAEDIARIMTMEEGKVLAESRTEVTSTAEVLEWFAEEGRRAYGRIVPSRAVGLRYHVVTEPIGPAVAFTPWNFPTLTPARKIGAALAAGCTLILKAAEETPGSAYELVRAFADAGLPAGVLNLVFGDPAEISAHLIASPIIRKVSFTGSVPVGKQLMRLCAENLQRTTMELGGHAPVIVCADADPDTASKIAVAGKFRNAGQVCVSPTRFFVHESILPTFTERFVAHTQALKLGDGLAPATTMGPLANIRRVQSTEKFVADALARGAKLRTGGKRLGNRGYFYEPTVLTDVPEDAMVMTAEPFGPIAPIVGFKDLDEAIARANSLPFGLASYAFTKSAAAAEKIGAGIRAGMLGINTMSISNPETPFGGVRESGHGREGSIEGLEAYMDVKFIAHVV